MLVITTFFFWYPTPNPNSPPEFDRADWYWLLGVVLLIQIGRFILRGRLWTPTLFDPWFAAFFALCLLNIEYSPYLSRGIIMLARPALGVAWVIYMVEAARNTRSIRPALLPLLLMALLVGFTALFTSQWREKSRDFLFILEGLPRLELFYAPGGFNPNEIGGAIAWLLPIAAGLMLFQWGEMPTFSVGRNLRISVSKILTYIAICAFGLLLAALVLGQSRLAIIGVFIALFAISITIVPKGRRRNLSLAGIALLVILQWSITAHVFPEIGDHSDSEFAQYSLTLRDERTPNQRIDMWGSALSIIADYPLTGVGMARFRYEPVREDYPIADFDYPKNPNRTDFRKRIVPHAHNEFLQIGTDLGLPGLAVFTMWNLIAVYMLAWCWWYGDRQQQIVAVTLAAGLFAHGVFGMGDSIPLWDRFNFIYWWILGGAAAQYYLMRNPVQVDVAVPHRTEV